MSGALSLGRSDRSPESRELYASILGWLTPGPVPDSTVPAARVTVLDERLSPVAGVQVVGMFAGATDSTFSCVTDPRGVCTVRGEPAPSVAAPAWIVSALTNATPCGGGTLEVEGDASTSLPLRFRATPVPRCDDGPGSYDVVYFPEADLTAVVVDATGLGDDVLRVSAIDTFTRLDGAAGTPMPPLDLQPIIVATGLGGGGAAVNAAHGAHLEGTPLGELLEMGGWTTPAGTPAASALVAGTELDIGAARHARLAGSSGRRVGTGGRLP